MLGSQRRDVDLCEPSFCCSAQTAGNDETQREEMLVVTHTFRVSARSFCFYLERALRYSIRGRIPLSRQDGLPDAGIVASP